MTAESLNAWGSGWAWFMARALIDSTVLLAVVALIWLPLRRKMSAQFAHGLFLLVLIKLAAPIPASWPSWTAGPSVRQAAARLSTWGDEGPPAPAPAEVEAPVVVAVAPEPIIVDAGSEPTVLATVPTPPASAGRPREATPLTISAILMIAWASVASVLLVRFFRAVAATRRLIREGVPVVDGSGWFPVDFEALRRAAGVRSTVRWTISPRVASPAVGGLFRPTVVMPPDLDDGLTPKQLTWVLLHELAHVRRGDLWVVTFQRLVQAVFFFHPAVHIASWIIDQLREYACDDAAMAAGHASRHDCGEGFLTIVGRAVEHAPAWPAPALGLFESRMLIHRRLLRILDSRRAVHGRLSPAAAAALAGMALVVLPYGRPRDASAGPSPSGPSAIRRFADDPRSFAPGASFLHDDRESSSGKPRSAVLAVAYSPDGGTVATGGEDGAVVLRDPATGSVRLRLEGHADAVTCLAFSPDGSTLATAGYDRTVRLWDARTGRPRAKLEGHANWIFALAFRPDGRALASAGTDRTIRLWDVASARAMATLTDPVAAIRALAFRPDGLALASAGADRSATLWDLRTGTPSGTLRGHRGTIRALAFAPDGRTLATAGEDGEVRLWDPTTGRERALLTGHAEMVLALSFSPSGATLASAGLDPAIRLWDPRSGRERASLPVDTGGVAALAFAPGARQIAAAGYDGTVKLWDAAAPVLAAAATLGHPGRARAVAFAPDGKTLYAAGEALALYDPIAGLIVEKGQPGEGTAVAASPDGRTVAVGALDGKIRLVDAATRKALATLDAHRGEVRALAFGPDGRSLGSGGGDGAVLVWDVASRSRREVVPAGARPVVGLRFSADGRTIALATADRVGDRPGPVAFLDVASGRDRAGLAGPSSPAVAVACSPDGRSVATVGPDGLVSVLDASTFALRGSWTQAGARSVAFGPDGRFLAAGNDDGEVILREADSGRKLATLRGHAGPVAGVAFAPDGRTLASAGEDRTVRLWNLAARRVTPRSSFNSDIACIGPVVASPDGKTLAFAEVAVDSPGHIVLWDPAGRRDPITLHGHDRGVVSLAFSPDGKTLASSSLDRTVRLWDARTGEALGEFATTGAVARLAFAPDGKTLATAGEDRVLTLWDVEGGGEVGRIEGFRGPIHALAFSPDGKKVATGGGRDGRSAGFGEVKVFDVASRAEVADLAGGSASVRSMAYSADGATLATGGVDATVRLWDVASGRARLVLGGFPDCIRALRISPDGRTLAVAGRTDGVVTLFDADRGVELARLVGHARQVMGLTFTPDGRTLATGGLDATIKLWDVPATRAGIARR